MKNDPIAFLLEAANSTPEIKYESAKRLIIADPLMCRSILGNEDKLFVEHSDFFMTRSGYFDDRPSQISIRREARKLLTDAWSKTDVDRHLGSFDVPTLWPHYACQILANIFMPALVRQDRTEKFKRIVNDIVRIRITERTEQGLGGIKSIFRRRRLIKAIRIEGKSVAIDDGNHIDALDIILKYAVQSNGGAKAELFLGIIFSAINSIAVSLSWIIYLAVKNDQTHARPEQIVNEGLRLFPISWLMNRQPAVEQKICGEQIGPQHEIVVSPFAAHRVAKYWPEPEKFIPERWTLETDKTAWMPFGAGPHSCPAMSLNLEILNTLVQKIFTHSKWNLELQEEELNYGPALSPPDFVLAKVGM